MGLMEFFHYAKQQKGWNQIPRQIISTKSHVPRRLKYWGRASAMRFGMTARLRSEKWLARCLDSRTRSNRRACSISCCVRSDRACCRRSAAASWVG